MASFSWLSLLSWSVFLISSVEAAWASWYTTPPGPYKIYKTEPDFIPSAVKVLNRSSEVTSDYVFIAPHILRTGFGPQIFDLDGELVWYGNAIVTKIRSRPVYALDFRPCDFLGTQGEHLCWSESRPVSDKGQGIRQGGANIILNNAYEPAVEEFSHMGHLTHPNPHEFRMVRGGESFVQAVYQKRSRDLRPYKGSKRGWIYDGCFQEINIRKRSVMFKWCALNHLEPWESYLFLNIPANKVNASTGTSGEGNYDDPWDFMHLNSVDKNDEGDYLVSSRHMSVLLKIAGSNNLHGDSVLTCEFTYAGYKPGEIIWRLGGKFSNFTFPDEVGFTRQHHASFVSVTNNETVISLFNNAWDGHTLATKRRSDGRVIRLNNETMTASLDGMYENPKPVRSVAQGNANVLPNGNVFVGWGSRPWWSEFHSNGTLLYHAETYINEKELRIGKLSNYRTFKQPWVGRPKTKPKIVAYSKDCRSSSPLGNENKTPLWAYVSWNGATEVKSWRFYLSVKGNKTWTETGTFEKKGFETVVELKTPYSDETPHWVSVEALDKDRNVLATTIKRTFVPIKKHKKFCDLKGCYHSKQFAKRFHYASQHNRSRSCSIGTRRNFALNYHIGLFILVAALIALEIASGLFSQIIHNIHEAWKAPQNQTTYERIQPQEKDQAAAEEGQYTVQR